MASGKHSAHKKKPCDAKAPGAAKAPKGGKAAQAPKGDKNSLKGVLIVVLALAVVVCAFAVKVAPRLFEQPAQVAAGEVVTVEIPAGSTTKQIADILKEGGVIARESEFIDTVKYRGVADQLKAGTYRFVGGEDIGSIIDTMLAGNAGYTLTIPEGYTARKIADTVASVCELDADEFYQLTLKASAYAGEYPFLEGAYNDSMEGYLFPDTYAVSYGATADEVVRMMLDNFSAQIAGVDMSYASSKNLTTEDVVILASMIEKESREDADKAGISGVFYNRLRAGMSLGSDVTTYYAVGKELTEELTVSDLNSDSPYNTRNPNHRGLPAGPICNPGIASLNAAAHPSEDDYLYFFYSQSEDKTMFYKDQASFDAAWSKYGQ
ncbi:MAG: endolytic transglycosylase MltG [Coriobacteriales bacterium]